MSETPKPLSPDETVPDQEKATILIERPDGTVKEQPVTPEEVGKISEAVNRGSSY